MTTLVRRAAGTASAVGLVAGLAMTAGVGVASAALPTECAQAGTTVTCTYNYTGAEAALPIPAGVNSVQVTATGGNNGNVGGNPGHPGIASGTVPVTPGSTLFIAVGGAGEWGQGQSQYWPGGWNGGGRGFGWGHGGGGASDVRTISRTQPGTLDSRLLVAAGAGGHGGTANVYGGDAGKDAVGGPVPGKAGGGLIGVGGDGSNGGIGGGGGGGGYRGGGGGGANATQNSGGGGGTFLVPAGGTTSVAPDYRAAQVVVTYEAPQGVLQVATTSDATGPVTDGQVVNYTTTFTNTGNGPVAVDRALVLSGLLDDADLVSGPTSADPALTVANSSSGVYGVTGTLAPGQSVTVTYSVTVKPYADQGDHNLVALVADPANLPAGTPSTCSGDPLCIETAAADSAAVPMVNPAVAGGVGVAVVAGLGAFAFLRRRNSNSAA
ncbi:hypothetical protein [Rhodococcus sp. ACT016]|uniref:DUF7927 domain-containing protein n=1 Tax=Rhodococcus sp. ACT016 TaxID=3134808 RepID=UPI003D2B5F13